MGKSVAGKLLPVWKKSGTAWYLEMLENVREEQLSRNWSSEKAMAKILDDENIGYERQVIINPFVADFSIPRMNLIIEIDGWHHKKRHRKDEVRDLYMEKLGLRVIRFLTSEVERIPLEVALSLQGYQSSDAFLSVYLEALRRSRSLEERMTLLRFASSSIRVVVKKRKKNKKKRRNKNKKAPLSARMYDEKLGIKTVHNRRW